MAKPTISKLMLGGFVEQEMRRIAPACRAKVARVYLSKTKVSNWSAEMVEHAAATAKCRGAFDKAVASIQTIYNLSES